MGLFVFYSEIIHEQQCLKRKSTYKIPSESHLQFIPIAQECIFRGSWPPCLRTAFQEGIYLFKRKSRIPFYNQDIPENEEQGFYAS